MEIGEMLQVIRGVAAALNGKTQKEIFATLGGLVEFIGGHLDPAWQERLVEELIKTWGLDAPLEPEPIFIPGVVGQA